MTDDGSGDEESQIQEEEAGKWTKTEEKKIRESKQERNEKETWKEAINLGK